MGQEGNDKALKHGAYIHLYKRRVDGRSRLAKHIKNMKAALTRDLINPPTTGQAILIDRVCYKVMTVHYIEQSLARGHGSNGQGKHLYQNYVSLANSLRADLQLLGIEPRMKDYISYLDEHENKQDAAG